eukprot:gnl/MRDRNA2_/MRDRNA2_167273_c0_seq1.p1 gnl/MRDRNA2_/MRDRNA2_167273_c0~~gnl/MRDRNA2_/MRDRNA2_167273_c0_seq1.p1  ORF type:complete len:424 (+),score=93.05 gnl/MRDRNA2_/MRDRNA2_167273_c0_seq1:23-1273(+)
MPPASSARPEVSQPQSGYSNLLHHQKMVIDDEEDEDVDAEDMNMRNADASPPGLRLSVAVMDHQGKRETMEDRHQIQNLTTAYDAERRRHVVDYMGVYDGHVGSEVAEELRSSMHEFLIADQNFPNNISEALRGAYAAFEEALPERAAQENLDLVEVPGSTSLSAVFSNGRIYLANLGDCRAVLARREDGSQGGGEQDPWPVGSLVEVEKSPNADVQGQRGIIVEVRSAAKKLYIIKLLRDGQLRPLRQNALKLLSELSAKRLTVDHKPDSEEERQRIEAAGGKVQMPSEGGGVARVAGLATSRSFGSAAKPMVSAIPDIFEHELIPSKDVFLVLASDGVWDVLEDQYVVDLVWDQIRVHNERTGPASTLQSAARLIVETALEAGSLDNLTCMIVHFSWRGDHAAQHSSSGTVQIS